jgi:hypothetical protein
VLVVVLPRLADLGGGAEVLESEQALARWDVSDGQ